MDTWRAITTTSTLTKTPSLGLIWGVAELNDYSLVVSDAEKHIVCTIDKSSGIYVLAGSGHAGFAEGVAEKALLNTPKGLALASEGRIFVADSCNHRIRLISPNGTVSTYAGCGKRGSSDGPIKTATLDLPTEVSCTQLHVLVAQFGFPFLRCIQDGMVTTLNSPASYALLNQNIINMTSNIGSPLSPKLKNITEPSSTSSSSKTQLDSSLPADIKSPILNYVKNQIASGPTYNTVIQLEKRLAEGEPSMMDGLLSNATFKSVNGLIFNRRGDVIVLDHYNHAVRHISLEGVVTTLSGCGSSGHLDGCSTLTKLSHPKTMVLTKRGELIISDTGNYCLRRIELGDSFKHLWASTESFKRNLNHILPTESSLHGSNAIPAFSDLTWGFTSGGNWKIHKAVVCCRLPGIFNDSVARSKFLEISTNPESVKLFWDFVYNDVFPIPTLELQSLQVFLELLQLFIAAQLQDAAEYTEWMISSLIEAIPSCDDLNIALTTIDGRKWTELTRICLRSMSLKTSNSSSPQLVKARIVKLLDQIPDEQFQSSIHKILGTPAGSHSEKKRKNKTKVPALPFGRLDRSLGNLLIKDDSTGRISYSDLILKINGSLVPCHRAILEPRWPLVSKALNGVTDMSTVPIVIQLPDPLFNMKAPTLNSLLWYLYTGDFEKMGGNDECTELVNLYPSLDLDDFKLKAHLYNIGWYDIGNAAPSFVQPAEPPSSSCSVQ